MKTVMFTQYGGPEVLQVVDSEIPIPRDGELLIKMAASGVSKPDYLMRTGAYPWTKGILPFHPGLYGSGTVSALGPGVSGFAVGDPVFVDHPVVCGCYSEYKTAPAGIVTKLPSGIDLKAAAVMTNYVIAWSLLTQVCGAGNGRSIYMKGAAGALGSAVVQLAPLAGYRMIASAGTDKKCDYLKSICSGSVFNYKTCDATKTVLELTGGKGADIILDQLAGDGMMSQLAMLSELGTIVVYNHLNGCPKTGLLEALIENMAKCQSVRVFSFHLNDGKPEMLKALKSEVFRLLSDGKINPFIFAEFDISDIGKAHALLDSGDFTGSLILAL